MAAAEDGFHHWTVISSQLANLKLIHSISRSYLMTLRQLISRICVLTVCLTAFSGTGFAQAVAGTGGISGVVRDTSGASIPGAKVVVANVDKGIRRNLETNEAGVFTAPALVPSAGYTVNATKEGFAPYDAKEIEILVGQNVNLNIVLNVAAAATTVEV